MQSKTSKIICPICLSKNIKKYGIQKNKLQNYQRYYCNNCKKVFSLQEKNKTYPINIILTALSLYNLGNTQTQVINKISRKFRTKPSQKTISNWINDYKNVCTFNKLRKQAVKLYSPDEIIEKHTFMHNNLLYYLNI
jgi:transposase-like protein